jgi:hypothetical protein
VPNEKLLLDGDSVLEFESPLRPRFGLKPDEVAGAIRMDNVGRIPMGGQGKNTGRGADPGLVSIHEYKTI